jgi:hypothetical protein
MLPYENLSLENMEGEIWKPIIGYEGYYLASNFGRIKSVERYVGYKIDGFMRIVSERIMSQITVKGWKYCSISKNGSNRSIHVARLIALAFIPNPENKPTVNHKNRVKDDNRLENLEWATHKEQTKNILDVGGRDTKSGIDHWNSKLVYQYNIIGELIKIHDTATSAAKIFNSKPSTICDCCNGRWKSAHGYIWSYVELNSSYFKSIKIGHTTKPKKILKKDFNGNILDEYENTRMAARVSGLGIDGIRDCCIGNRDNYKGFIWSYE